MIYSFPQFKLTIQDPEIQIVNVQDNWLTKTCRVDVVLKTTDTSFGVTLEGFSYNQTWYDIDITNFVNQKMTEYLL